MTITVFANFRIDDENRFNRLKKSFFSFYKCDIDMWVINTRGKLKLKVNTFLEKNIIQKYKLSNLQLKKGWFAETTELLDEIKSDYVFIWNEDHKNQLSFDEFNKIILEIKKNKVDVFSYSFYAHGELPWSIKILEEHKELDKILYLNYNESLHKKRIEIIKNKKSVAQNYIISLISIMHKNFFKKIILANDPPIKRWSRFTPFDFEKGPYDTHWLPFVFGVPKYEFFQCIDKDHDESGNIIFKEEASKKKLTLYIFFYNILKFFAKPPVIFIREFLNKKISQSRKNRFDNKNH